MTIKSMSMIVQSIATSNGYAKKMRMVDDEFSAIETLYGIGYRYNEE